MKRQTRSNDPMPVVPSLPAAASLAAWPWEAQAQFAAAWIDQLAALQANWIELALAMPSKVLPSSGWQTWTAEAGGGSADMAAGPYAGCVQMMDLGRQSMERAVAFWADAWKPAHTEDFVA